VILEEGAFRACKYLASISLPSPLTTIAERCFEPKSKLAFLGEAAFNDCPTLQSMCLSSSLDVSANLVIFGHVSGMERDPLNRTWMNAIARVIAE
jgi:hypothetical protein